METVTIYSKILVIRSNQYSEIVVEDLNREYTDDLKYLMVVKLPNWESESFDVGDVGYLQFQPVKSGEQFLDRNKQDYEVYKYTNNYFINFFKEQDLCKQKKFKF